ncbi:hypothetical protein ERD78_06160 [Allopusillimonas soli]|uniref:Sulfotransferase family protein n=1 Tax=Allopusillimonas soli TaxID=659016 RepID=A0A853FD38_9BURK|nr:hypothetical protein [Allopusillimonas soli]NYT36451.1 hypothetical protein [Allopusillimonas soli]TEA74960.1 hypothetical protein ERD78_06160 [Allopusillimonas soli]
MASKSRIVVVAGFHRSLTSAVAQWLHNAGLPMGSYLMPPNPSNPDGHFEDMPLVALHDQWLARHNTFWQFHDEVSLGMERNLPYVERYIERRNRIDGPVWGMKDPRQCLFLPRWSEALGDAGHYVILLRHWSASIQSLYRRHSELLAFQEGSASENGAFWYQPELAADMWIAYCRRILAFIEKCPKVQRLVLTQQSILSGISLIELVNKQFDIHLNPKTHSSLKPSLAHNQVDCSICRMISDEKIAALNSLWANLLRHADIRSEYEQPKWGPNIQDEQSKRQDFANDLLNSAEQNKENNTCTQTLPLKWREQLSFLHTYPRTPASLGSILEAIESRAKFDSHIWEQFALVCKFKGQLEQAKSAFLNVILSGHTPPYIFMYLGTCYEAMLDEESAEHFYKLALLKNPNNARFYTHMASLWLTIGRYAEADELLHTASQKGIVTSPLLILRAIALDHMGKTQEAISLLKSQTNADLEIQKTLLTLLLKQDYSLNKSQYKDWVKKRCQNPKFRKASYALIASVKSYSSRLDLANRIATHLTPQP